METFNKGTGFCQNCILFTLDQSKTSLGTIYYLWHVRKPGVAKELHPSDWGDTLDGKEIPPFCNRCFVSWAGGEVAACGCGLG